MEPTPLLEPIPRWYWLEKNRSHNSSNLNPTQVRDHQVQGEILNDPSARPPSSLTRPSFFADSVVVGSVRRRAVPSAAALCIGLSILVLLLCLMFRIFTRAHRESRRVRRFADANECPVLIEEQPTPSTPQSSELKRGKPTIMLHCEGGQAGE